MNDPHDLAGIAGLVFFAGVDGAFTILSAPDESPFDLDVLTALAGRVRLTTTHVLVNADNGIVVYKITCRHDLGRDHYLFGEKVYEDIRQ